MCVTDNTNKNHIGLLDANNGFLLPQIPTDQWVMTINKVIKDIFGGYYVFEKQFKLNPIPLRYIKRKVSSSYLSFTVSS